MSGRSVACDCSLCGGRRHRGCELPTSVVELSGANYPSFFVRVAVPLQAAQLAENIYVLKTALCCSKFSIGPRGSGRPLGQRQCSATATAVYGCRREKVSAPNRIFRAGNQVADVFACGFPHFFMHSHRIATYFLPPKADQTAARQGRNCCALQAFFELWSRRSMLFCFFFRRCSACRSWQVCCSGTGSD